MPTLWTHLCLHSVPRGCSCLVSMVPTTRSLWLDPFLFSPFLDSSSFLLFYRHRHTHTSLLPSRRKRQKKAIIISEMKKKKGRPASSSSSFKSKQEAMVIDVWLSFQMKRSETEKHASRIIITMHPSVIMTGPPEWSHVRMIRRPEDAV